MTGDMSEPIRDMKGGEKELAIQKQPWNVGSKGGSDHGGKIWKKK